MFNDQMDINVLFTIIGAGKSICFSRFLFSWFVFYFDWRTSTSRVPSISFPEAIGFKMSVYELNVSAKRSLPTHQFSFNICRLHRKNMATLTLGCKRHLVKVQERLWSNKKCQKWVLVKEEQLLLLWLHIEVICEKQGWSCSCEEVGKTSE